MNKQKESNNTNCEGYYEVSVSDVNQCVEVDSFYVPETGLILAPTVTNNICAGDSSGSIIF